MSGLDTSATIAVVGAGTMGAGIAQLAASAGHRVLLFDAGEGAAQNGKAKIGQTLERLVTKGKMTAEDTDALLSRIAPVEALAGLSGAALVIEAIIEDLDIKRGLFADLEAIVGPETILATNTSSLSVTAIARDLLHPERMLGMHFFNPAPVMKLVEVVSGVATSRKVAETTFATAETWGKIAVHTKSTPGFIVNRVARAYYAEPLRLLEEQVADVATLDTLLTEGCGFRMGPFALMDLIGNDVNYAVSVSVFNAYFQEPRFRPSILQLELVNSGRLGRKSGRGFYEYGEGQGPAAPPATDMTDTDAPQMEALDLLGETETQGAIIALTDGRTAGARAQDSGRPVLVFDLMASSGSAKRVAYACSPDLPEATARSFEATMQQQGIVATKVPDWPGLVTMRTVAMLANEAFEAVMQGVATEAEIDAAMRYGVNYPKGPMAWARETGLPHVLSVLDNLKQATGDPRYRASFLLRRSANAV
ncbi:3-hydroxyacyl-CoA dehydrogenase [Roseovarius pacificus]|uniref:3-hydroxyacyl-CoA dehydrogenase n=1 Tax=Roseovarius pacificus TaxID=337701 RepID=A0A1M7HKI0_9RHOB|nr:3-hydroxyacyl-CoA dehydrogenase [Roseovarius pacificus]SHM29006.1 3-hydroxyacyl-CoA dehydrogenase [Roseovarius pacificus]